MKIIFKLFLSAILLSCTVLTTQAAVDSQATEATVLRVQGSATVMLPGATDSIPLTVGMKLPTGATIKTGAGSEVDLRPFAGGMTAVKPNTTVDLEELSVNKGRSGNITKQTAKLNLRSGNLISTLDPARKAINNYGIRTPKGVAAARGTVYAVSVTQTGSTVATLTGTVTLTPILPGGGFGTPIVVNLGTGMVISGVSGASESTPVSLASLIAAEAQPGGNTGEGSMTEAISQAVTTVSAAVASGDSSAVGGNGSTAASVLAAVVNVASSANPTQASTFATQAVTAVSSPTSGISAAAKATAAAAITEAAVQGAVKTTVANGGDASAVSTITNAIASSAVTAATASGTNTSGIVTAAARGAVTSTAGTSVTAPTTVTTNGTTTNVSTITTTTPSTPVTPPDTSLISPSG